MTLSVTKNCLFLALAISPVASAQIVTESFETTTYPTDWVRPNDTTAKTEDVTGIMERGPVFGDRQLFINPSSGDSWTYHDTGTAFQPHTTYTLIFYAGCRQNNPYQQGGDLEYGFWSGIPASPMTEPSLAPDLSGGDRINTSVFPEQTLVKVDSYTFTTGSDVSGMGNLVVFFRNLQTTSGRSYIDHVVVDVGSPAQPKPNILWIVAEDMSPHIGPYGNTYATTPNLDTFSDTALRYNHAWSNAPVCSAARSTLITGMYGTTLGVNFHRSADKITPPDFVKFYPRLMQEAGYYTSNNSKTDYNAAFTSGEEWKEGWNDSGNSAHWRNRPAGMPFLSVFNLAQPHEGSINDFSSLSEIHHDPNTVPLPECHPDTTTIRQQWAHHFDTIQEMDTSFQNYLQQLKDDGLDDDTIVFFYSDHGSSMPGYKRYVGNRGQQVALLIHIPDQFAHLRPPAYSEGGATNELVSFVDFAPTLLSLAGNEEPDWHQGRAFLGAHQEAAPSYLYGYADRFDERTWVTRSVHDGRYVYIRNYRPDQPHGLHTEYAYTETFIGEWQSMFHNGELTPEQSHYWTPQGSEQLYDLLSDPDEVRNLANSPEHQTKLVELRAAHLAWRAQHPDAGLLKEGIMYELADSQSMDVWSLLQDATHYPTDLPDTLDRASMGDNSDIATLFTRLSHAHQSVRHWALIGLMLHGRDTVRTHEASILTTMADPSFWVRMTAAHVLATHGNATNQSAALDLLFVEGAKAASNTSEERKVMYALHCLDQVPYIPASRRDDINTLQNSTSWTKNFRRHMWYSYYEQYNNPLLTFRHTHGLDRFGVDDHDNPSGDGIDNLTRFAFNLSPNEGDLLESAAPRVLAPGGTAGLPRISHNVATSEVNYEFIRRIDVADSQDEGVYPTPNIRYQPQSSTDLINWFTDQTAESVSPINSEWERITLSLPTSEKSFHRVNITH